jgi:hypothetical protein
LSAGEAREGGSVDVYQGLATMALIAARALTAGPGRYL